MAFIFEEIVEALGRTDRLKDGMQYLMQAPRKGNIITNNSAMAPSAGLLQDKF